jgi:hypothetical protein
MLILMVLVGKKKGSVKSDLFNPREYGAHEIRVAEMCDGHPRSLEYLKKCINDERRLGRVDFKHLFDKTVEQLSERYQLSECSLDILNAVIVKRKLGFMLDKVSASLSVRDAIAKGYFYNRIDKPDIPFVTPIFFHGHLRNLGSTYGEISRKLCSSEELPSNAEEVRVGNAFEIHHSSWEILFRLLLKERGQSFVSLVDLYGFRREIKYSNCDIFNIKFRIGDSPDICYQTAQTFEDFIKNGQFSCVANTCYLLPINCICAFRRL